MKKTMIVIAVIALAVVAVLASQAVASGLEPRRPFPTFPPITPVCTPTPTPTPTPMCPGVCIETLSGTFIVEDQDDWIVSYPGVRHVSLTLYAVEAFDPGDYATLYMYFDNWRVVIADLEYNTTNTYEFDAQQWQIGAGNSNGVLPIEIGYRATITFPSDQW
jgi:hypothetical protein